MRLLYSRHLEHFLAIYHARSLRKAAESSGVTQPALTKSLRLLESALQVSLFERHTAGVLPTPAAEILRRHSQHIVNSAGYLDMELAMLRGGDLGTLRVGCGMVWSVTRMPHLMARLHARFPRLEISLLTGVAEQLVPRLLDGELDILFASIPRQPLSAGFVIRRLPDAGMAVFARREHRLARRRKLQLADLAAHDFIGFADDQEWQRQAELVFGAAGVAVPRTVLRSTSLETLLATVAESDSLTILSELLLERATAAGLVRLRFPGPLWRLPMGISYREQGADVAPMQYLLSMALASAAAPRMPLSSWGHAD